MGGKTEKPICPEPGCGKKLVRCKVLQPRDVNYGRTYDVCTKCYLRFWLDDESYNILREATSPSAPAAHTLPTPFMRSRRPSTSRAQSTPPVQPKSPPVSPPTSGYGRRPSTDEAGRPPLFSLSRHYGPSSGGSTPRTRHSSSGSVGSAGMSASQNSMGPQPGYSGYRRAPSPAPTPVPVPHHVGGGQTRPQTPNGSSDTGNTSPNIASHPPTPTASAHPSRPGTPSGRSAGYGAGYGSRAASSRASSPDRSIIYSDDGIEPGMVDSFMESRPFDPRSAPVSPTASRYQSPPSSFRGPSAPQSGHFGGRPSSYRAPSAPPTQPRARTASFGANNNNTSTGSKSWFGGLRSSSPAPGARTITLSLPRQSYARVWTPRNNTMSGGGSGASSHGVGRRLSVGAHTIRWGEQGELIRESRRGSSTDRYQPLGDPYAAPYPPPQERGYAPAHAGYAPSHPGYAPPHPGYASPHPGYTPSANGYPEEGEEMYPPEEDACYPPEQPQEPSFNPPESELEPEPESEPEPVFAPELQDADPQTPQAAEPLEEMGAPKKTAKGGKKKGKKGQ